MRVRFLAFDSMGTRSMCTVIESDDAVIIVDPGAALGPRRYGLKPHPLELERLREHKRAIEREASRADLLIITHYHYDHFPRPGDDIEWLRGKRILLKDPERMINFSQKNRARVLLDRLERLSARVEVADSREVRIGGCRIRFSSPVEHGGDPGLGYVLEVLISDRGEKIIHSSDVEGFISASQAKFVLENRPDMLICDGPMTYMLGYRLTDDELRSSLRNLSEIIAGGFLQEIIMDHHLLRDLEWRSRIRPIIDLADSRGVRLRTAAAYMGLEDEPLEANRKKLYEESGWRGRERPHSVDSE